MSGNGTRIAAALARASARGEPRSSVRVGPREVAARMRGGRLVEQELGAVEVARPRRSTSAASARVHAGLGRQPARGRPRASPTRRTCCASARCSRRTRASRSARTSSSSRVDGPHEVTARVWERGAGETPSSGTSAVAAAAAAIAHGWCESPVTVHFPGGELAASSSATAAAQADGSTGVAVASRQA